MLLMLGVVSSVMMLYDADMLLVRKIRVVVARRRRFLLVCFGQSFKVPRKPFSRKPYMRYDTTILILRGHGRGAAGS